MCPQRQRFINGKSHSFIIVLGIRQFVKCSVYILVIKEPDHISEDSETAYDTHYCSVPEAMRLITHSLDGDKKMLREFIKNVDVAFELEHPHKHDNLLKFVKTKITDVMSKLTDLTNTWALEVWRKIMPCDAR